jgi:hypothetical protein
MCFPPASARLQKEAFTATAEAAKPNRSVLASTRLCTTLSGAAAGCRHGPDLLGASTRAST